MHTKKTLKNLNFFKKIRIFCLLFCFYDKHCGPEQGTIYFIFKLLCHNPSLREIREVIQDNLEARNEAEKIEQCCCLAFCGLLSSLCYTAQARMIFSTVKWACLHQLVMCIYRSQCYIKILNRCFCKVCQID